MAKGAILILFVVGVCFVRGIRIDVPQIYLQNRLFWLRSLEGVKQDPRCERNGIFPIPDDCTSYLACRDGMGQVRHCPEGLRFDSVKHCTMDEADCGGSSSNSLKRNLCPEDYGHFAYPSDCHKYVICNEGKPIIKTCPAGQTFNILNGCTDHAVCTTNSEPSESLLDLCPEDYGHFAYPPDCHKYVICNEGKPTIKTCPAGQAFNIINGCTDHARCITNSEPSVPSLDLCPEDYGHFPYPLDCHKYVICNEGKPIIKTCPAGQTFNIINGCTDHAVCTTDSEPSESSLDDTDTTACAGNGNYPYYDDCTKYIQCTNGIGNLVNCPEGYHFSSKDKRCESPCDARCDRDIECTDAEEEVCEPGSTDKTEDRYDCSVYYECRHGTLRTRRCLFGRYFDYRRKTCVRREEANCIFHCITPEGLYPVPHVREKYIECHYGKPKVRTCPSEKIFDAVKAHCVEKEDKSNDVLDVLHLA